jgi:hypothetical protein
VKSRNEKFVMLRVRVRAKDNLVTEAFLFWIKYFS